MITTNSRIEGKKPTLHCQVSDLQKGGSSDLELQKQRASHWKQPAASVSNLSCMWRERAFQKSLPKSKQQCPGKSILAKGQERSPRSERADKSFVSISLASMLNIPPITLDTTYDIEMADGNLVGTNTVIQGCTLILLNQPFEIDLMLIKLGSFDVVIGMDWLSKYHARIICDEKVVHIPIDGETLIIRGAAPMARAPYRLALSEMQEIIRSDYKSTPILALPEGNNDFVIYYDASLQGLGAVLILQHILDQKELNMIKRRWLELLTDYDCEIHYHPGKANVVADALSRKEQIKPLRVRALVMTLHLKLPSQILKAQTEAIKEENIEAENL
ncbi:putative reverse transcriptase domain-containing protein [Tanacetum coccineum]